MADRAEEAYEIRRCLLDLADRVVAVCTEEGSSEEAPPHASTPGQRLVEARSAMGMSQAELSARTGVSVGAIMKFEKGYTQPRVKTLMALADAVNQPWERFQDERGDT